MLCVFSGASGCGRGRQRQAEGSVERGIERRGVARVEASRRRRLEQRPACPLGAAIRPLELRANAGGRHRVVLAPTRGPIAARGPPATARRSSSCRTHSRQPCDWCQSSRRRSARAPARYGCVGSGLNRSVTGGRPSLNASVSAWLGWRSRDSSKPADDGVRHRAGLAAKRQVGLVDERLIRANLVLGVGSPHLRHCGVEAGIRARSPRPSRRAAA